MRNQPHSTVYRKILTGGALFALLVLTVMLVWGIFPERVDDTRFAEIIRAAGERHGVDSRLIRALIYKESRFNPRAQGKAGEIGLMQILPNGAIADYCRILKCGPFSREELFLPELNIEIGTWYLARALQRWGSYRFYQELALCQYNAGESRARGWAPENPRDEVIPRINIESTRDYVKTIMSRYRYYCGGPDA